MGKMPPSAVPQLATFGQNAPPVALCLLRARLAALGGSALSGGENGERLSQTPPKSPIPSPLALQAPWPLYPDRARRHRRPEPSPPMRGLCRTTRPPPLDLAMTARQGEHIPRRRAPHAPLSDATPVSKV